MKKVFIIAAAAIVLAACTYKSEYSSNRTPANLASLNVELLNNSGIAAALTLVDIDIQHKDTILTAGFDTLITPEAFAERFGYSITEMDIQRTADSTWSFTSTGTGAVSFAGTIVMTGRNEEKFANLRSVFTGLYDEGNGFTAEFSSSKLEFSLRTIPVMMEGLGYTTQRRLLCFGDVMLKTYMDSQLLDSVTTTFKGDDLSY